MRRIVVGVDGSDSSLEAAGWAAGLATAVGAEIVVVNAYIPVQSEIRPDYAQRLRDEQTQRLEEWCTGVLDGTEHRVEVRNGDARDVLPAAAGDHDADLLVIATTGSTGHAPGFLHLGSVAEYLAHHAERPLAVIAPEPSRELGRVVVAVDGSPPSRNAVRWVADLADATEAAVTAVAVEEPKAPIYDADGAELDEATWRPAAEQVVASDWAEPLAGLEGRFRAVVSRQAPVAEAILDVAGAEAADLLVVGARGVGGVTGLRIGGVALAVLHRADLAVVLVPPVDTEI
jgi:nucleotide-binding universal stress UspA family protein